MESSVAPAWHRQFAARLALLWPLKAFGTMGFMALFFWGYFTVLHNPLVTPFVMPATRLDHWIGFSAAALPFYVSLWVYVSLAPALIGNLRALLAFGQWIAWMCLFCLVIFWAFPTSTPAFDVDWAAHPEFAFLKGVDASGNAFPSLHVASAVFSAIWLDRLFARMSAPKALAWLSALQCALIVWSTVATRQHVVLDAVGGALVGAVFAALSLRRSKEV